MEALWDEKKEYNSIIEYIVKDNLTLDSAIRDATSSNQVAVLCARTFGEDEGEWIYDEVQTQATINTFLLGRAVHHKLGVSNEIELDFYEYLGNKINKHYAKKIENDVTDCYNKIEFELRGPIDFHFEAGVKPSDFMGDSL